MFPDDMFAPDPLAEIAEEKTLQLKDGERRNVAILFADLKGFTAMSEKLDPEFVQSTIDKIMSVFTQVIKSHGGYVDKYSGDEIMALFGAKVASEVDTERAIRSGLKMLENLEKFNEYMKRQSEFEVVKEPIGIRIGINTGLVTTGKIGEGREGDFTVYGDTVNLASRLESNAPVNSIMVPESIEKVLSSHFEFIDEGNIKVKGKTDPISVFTIGKVKELTSAGKDKYSTQFVGREKELKQLHSAYEAAVDNVGSDDCHVSMVTISADGGIGKTRLLHEFLNQALPDARSSNYLSVGRATNVTSQPFFMFLSLFRHYFHVSESDSQKMIGEKIQSGYDDILEFLHEEEKESLLTSKALINFLFGIPSEDERLKARGKDLQAHIHIAIFTLLRSMALRCNQSSIPMTFMLEDLHWIDDASLATLEHCLAGFSDLSDKSGITSLFMLNFRPSFKVPSMISTADDYMSMELAPLPDENSMSMIENAFNEDALPEYELKNMLQISSGNPFYMEELIAYVHGHHEKESLTIEEILTKYPLPTSLNALVLSRVDSLPEKDKSVLQTASIMGMKVQPAILASLHEKLHTDSNVSEVISSLVKKDILMRETEDEYMFKSSIAREVIYEAILKSNRKMLHLEIGNIMEDTFNDNLDAYYYELAEHFDEGKDLDKAFTYLEKSGHKAKQLLDLKLAGNFYDRLSKIFIDEKYQKNVLSLRGNEWTAQNANEENILNHYLRIELLKGDMFLSTGRWKEAENILHAALIPAKATNDELSHPRCATKLSIS